MLKDQVVTESSCIASGNNIELVIYSQRMKVHLSDISPHGLEIKSEISLESLNRRMCEGKNNDILFTSAPLVDIVIHRNAGGAHSNGSISTRYKQLCSHCAKELERTLEIPFDFVFEERPTDEYRSSPDKFFEEDVGVTFIDNDEINLEPLIQESLILALDQYWHPPRDAAGICSLCNKKCFAKLEVAENKGTSLGSLLKKAGVS